MKVTIKNPKISTCFKAERIYPALENLEVAPTTEEQNFKSSKYGFDNVKVKAIEGETLEITPTIEAQEHTGIFDKVNVKGIEAEELNITPSTEEQVQEGMFDKVTVAGETNLVPDNIKEGTSIFGVEGTAKTSSVKITSGYYLFDGGYRTDYVNEILDLCEGIDNCYYMFSNCRNLTSIDLSKLDTSNVTNMGYMFYYCDKLTELDVSNFDTSNVTNAQSMFRSCTKLTELDLSNFDMSKVTSIGDIFVGTTGLINLKSFKNLGKGFVNPKSNYALYRLRLSDNTSLTKESLLDVITNGLYDLNLTYDVANGGTLYRQSLVLGSTNLAKLTAEEIAIATNKGWDVT